MSKEDDAHEDQMRGLAKLFAILSEAEVETLTGGAPSHSQCEPNDGRGTGGDSKGSGGRAPTGLEVMVAAATTE